MSDANVGLAHGSRDDVMGVAERHTLAYQVIREVGCRGVAFEHFGLDPLVSGDVCHK